MPWPGAPAIAGAGAPGGIIVTVPGMSSTAWQAWQTPLFEWEQATIRGGGIMLRASASVMTRGGGAAGIPAGTLATTTFPSRPTAADAGAVVAGRGLNPPLAYEGISPARA